MLLDWDIQLEVLRNQKAIMETLAVLLVHVGRSSTTALSNLHNRLNTTKSIVQDIEKALLDR